MVNLLKLKKNVKNVLLAKIVTIVKNTFNKTY
jgi:hypothetical protein